MMFNRGFNEISDFCGRGLRGEFGWGPDHNLYGMIGGGVLVIAAVVVLVIWLVKRTNKGNNELIDLLKTKYASGEITEEEYLKRKAVLKK